MSTFLVTGGAGFIGSHLCDRLLAEGKRVVAVDDLSNGRIAHLAVARSYGQQFTFENLDVRSDALPILFRRHRPEVVMHLAAQASVAVSTKDPAGDASVNVMGMLNVLEAAAAAGARKVVYAASGGTLYGEPRRLPAKETARSGARPTSPYGISKAAGVDYLRFFRESRELDFTALALANVYGSRQDPQGEAGVVAAFTSQMLEGEIPTIFGDGEQTRDYVFVEDTVHAFALAAEKGSGLVINVGTGLETTVNRVYQLLADLIGFRRSPKFGPPREGDVRASALDPSLAADRLGWTPWTPLEDGLAATVDALRD
jgi:UDP-glucose 4-epimerase